MCCIAFSIVCSFSTPILFPNIARVPRLATIPFPPVLAFPNIEILFIAFTFTGVSTSCAAVMGIGSLTSVLIGGFVWLVCCGGVVYTMFTTSSLVAKGMLGVCYVEEETEIGMDADPLTRCCFPGKNRRSGAWETEYDDSDLDAKNERILDMSMIVKTCYHVFVKQGRALVGENGSSMRRRGKNNKVGIDNGEDDWGPNSGLRVEEVDALARFGFVFNQFKGDSFTQHYWTIMLIVRGLIVMPAGMYAVVFCSLLLTLSVLCGLFF